MVNISLDKILLSLSLTFLSLFVIGYLYGGSENSFTIPFVKKYANPELYKNDYFVNELTYPPFFPQFIDFFINLIRIEYVYFALFLLFRFLFFYGFLTLAEYLMDKKIAILSALLIILISPIIPASGILSNQFNPQDMATTILLFGLLAYLLKKYIIAFALVGFTANIHPQTAIFIFSMFLFPFLLKFKKEFQHIFKYSLLTLSLTLPIILFAIFEIDNPLFPSDETIKLLQLTVANHLFPSLWSYGIILKFILFSLAVIFSFNNIKNIQRKHNEIKLFFIGIILIIFTGLIFSEIIPISFVLTLNPFKVLRFVVIFGSIYISAYLLSKNKNALFSLLILLIVVAIPLISWYNKLTTTDDLIIRIIENDENDKWHDVQKWANKNTNIDSIFSIPPYISEDFRSFSERNVFVSNIDGKAIYDFNLIEEWWKRMQILGYNYDNFYSYGKNEYNSLDFSSLAKQFNFNYVITSNELDLPLVYKNSKYFVYKLS